ncbi:uracil phosphoribosyltransferase-domain-containing protein [Lipomyces kononenkoae]|uniref:Uracil phosphoribosyltransferase-domain-containing protein n=1 Tax=Lipomyces kononenkoae TaxID=34357 RepID=A0ACC3SSP3_LIPKO
MSLPENVHVSTHPLLQSLVSQLRSASTDSHKARALTASIASILAVVALNQNTFSVVTEGCDITPLQEQYNVTDIYPSNVVLVPILRSGLSMIDSFLRILPFENVPIHYLGLYRDKTTLSPIEYYNKLPVLKKGETIDLAVVLDPVIATGGTAAAVIQSLKEWGAKKIILVSIIVSEEGVARAATEWPEGVEVYCAAVDTVLSSHGYIIPGVGDIGDRLNHTL